MRRRDQRDQPRDEVERRLFGVAGLTFVQRPYTEQAQLMANVLGLIDADELGDEIIELTGPVILPMPRRCQLRYEAMVQARAMRLNRTSADLRVLRSRVRRLIVRYAGAVITMLDQREPESLELVESALLPMLTIRSARVVAESEIQTQVVPAIADRGVEAGPELGEVGQAGG